MTSIYRITDSIGCLMIGLLRKPDSISRLNLINLHVRSGYPGSGGAFTV